MAASPSPGSSPSGNSLIARLGLLLGPLLALALHVGPHFGWELVSGQPTLNSMAAVAVLMAVWWMTEAISLAATALVPLVLFPLLKIPPGSGIAAQYADSMIFLFLGGFLLALAIEESGAHRRLALGIIAMMGDNPRRLVLGFMLATALLSMWLSNTATTMMLLPIAISVLGQADRSSCDTARLKNLGVALMLGLAYSASIGGMATLIGTPPNALFAAMYRELYPNAPQVSFFAWMVFACPFSLLMLGISWLLLTFVLFPVGGEPLLGGREVVRAQLAQLGPVTRHEVRMLCLFGATALLWILREPVRGFGWAPWLGVDRLADGTRLVDDGTIAMAMALLCFIVPAGDKSGRPLLEWKATARLPWGILLLFGGGLALAHGMQVTGLDKLVGQQLAAQLHSLSDLGVMAVITLGMTFLTEVTSNTASVNMILPILASTANELQVNPLLMMIPATLSASCAFMLPVATPPNAIVYGSGRLRIAHMIRAGICLNLLGVVFVVLTVYFLASVS